MFKLNPTIAINATIKSDVEISMDKKNETSCTRTGNSIKDLGCFKMYFIDDCKSIFIVKNKINLKSKLYPSSEK